MKNIFKQVKRKKILYVVESSSNVSKRGNRSGGEREMCIIDLIKFS